MHLVCVNDNSEIGKLHTLFTELRLTTLLHSLIKSVLKLNDYSLLNLFLKVCTWLAMSVIEPIVVHFLWLFVFWLQIAIEPFALLQCLWLYKFPCDVSLMKKRNHNRSSIAILFIRASVVSYMTFVLLLFVIVFSTFRLCLVPREDWTS